MSKAKEYLQKIQYYDTRINAGLEDLQSLEEMVKRITPALKLDVVSFSGSQDKLGETVAKITDLKRLLNEWTDEFVDRKREALELLNKVENTEKKPYFDVLHKRYVCYKSFGDIAAEMKYCERQIHNIHGNALVAFEKLLEGQ